MDESCGRCWLKKDGQGVGKAAGIAQLIERRACKADVVGLSPTTGSKKIARKRLRISMVLGFPHVIDHCVVSSKEASFGYHIHIRQKKNDRSRFVG